MGSNNTNIITVSILWLCIILAFSVPINARIIYVTSTGNDAHEGTESKPILTLYQAKVICKNASDASFTILLRGGDTFTEHKATPSDVVDKTCAFVWDIDKPLTLSTYGPYEKATLYGGYYAHNGGPVAAIAIQEGSTQEVLIENLAFEMWEEGAIILEETEDVTIRNVSIDKTGTHYFTDEEDRGAFMQAPIYPQAAKRVLIEHVEITDAHNWRGDRGGLHGFYCTRMGDLEIRNCLLVNISGSAFKIRRQPRDRSSNNIHIHDNACYYTGLSSHVPEEESYQPGFLRYSGETYKDGAANCPTGVVIENNIFHYPFCWDSEGEDCRTATAMKCSVSNKTACGENACSNDPTKVKWVNNDFKYQWEKTDRWTGRNTTPPSVPTNLQAAAVSDVQIDLTWEHDEVNGERFVIQRKSGNEPFKALRIVDSQVKSYSDKQLSTSTHYTYRIKACHDAACSAYSNEASCTTHTGAQQVTLIHDPAIPTISFAAKHLQASLLEKKYAVYSLPLSQLASASSHIRIILTTQDNSKTLKSLACSGVKALSPLDSEGYAIRIQKGDGYTAYWIIGGDVRGAMIGGLDVTEKIKGEGSFDAVQATDKNPYIKKRGLKFNIPLDARTPSYSDNNTIAQQNIPHMWDIHFWRTFLDEMALNRLNLLTLWTTAAFPSLVRVPGYPKIGLDDVKRTTLPVTQFGTKGSASNMVTREVLDHLETIKTLSLDDKTKFWQEVMQYAHDRGIDIYIYTWNVFAFGTEDSGYGITDAIDNPATRDYFRKATKALVETYPLLKGIGITAGENLSDDDKEDEKFLFETYGRGVNDALASNPQRTFRLIHRLGDITEAKKAFVGLNPRCRLSFCYKYSKAHVYSSVAPYWIHKHEFLEEIGDATTFFITVRDDSHYYLRGGSDPAFTRAYIKHIPNVGVNFEGFQLGPDGIVWAREYVSRKPDSPPQLMLKKRWYSLRLWGQLAYDPDLPDTHFVNMLKHRFPYVNAEQLFEAWSKASQVVPLVNRFHNYKAYLDYQWSPEVCDSSPGYNSETGFHGLDTFIRIKTQQTEGLVGIPDYMAGDRNGTTPFEVAEDLIGISQDTFNAVRTIDITKSKDKELVQTVSDIKALSYLGGYYAHKISASTHKALFDETKEVRHKEAAVRDLQQASRYWWDYSHQLDSQYKPMYYSRLKKTVNVLQTQKYVDQEIIDLGGEVPDHRFTQELDPHND